MTGEKRSSDLSSRLSVKRGGKLISKTLNKSSSPPSISAPPRAAVGASKVKKDEVQRRKNSFHEMFRSSTKEKEAEQAPSLNVHVANSMSHSPSQGSRANVHSRAQIFPNSQLLGHEKSADSEMSRVAELEAALVLAKEEIAALRQALERTKQDAEASIEIAKHQATEANRQVTTEGAIDNFYAHSSSDVGKIDREATLLSQNNELRSRIAEVEELSIAQSEALHSEEDWDELTLRLHEVEKESNIRLQQLLSLKSSISSLTRADSQVSDSELADSFSQLANRVREWVVSNYRRTKINFDDLPESTMRMLRSIKADYEKIDQVDKLALFQAIVSKSLMQIFDEPLVIGMPDHDIFVRLNAHFKDTQYASDAAWEWRRTTIRLIESSTQASTIRRWRVQALDHLAIELEATMRSISSVKLTATAQSTFMGIMNSAVDLQRTMSLQRVMYHVTFLDKSSEIRTPFDDRVMEPVNDLEYLPEDGAGSAQQRIFNFCVFPCLEKTDHGTGNIVFKARVCRGVG